MAHGLTLYVSAGSGFSPSSLDLIGTAGINVLHYEPTAAPWDQATVTESIQLLLYGAAVTDIEANIIKINKVINQARLQQQTRAAGYVFLTFTPDGSGTPQSAEILDGYLEYDPRSLYKFPWSIYHKIQATLKLTRHNWWDSTVATLSPTNDNGGSNIVFNSNDGSGVSPNIHENWLKVAAASIPGDLPCPTWISMKNLTAGSVSKIWLANEALQGTITPSYFVREAEAAVGATPTVDATCSNGNKVVVTLGTTNETDLLNFLLQAPTNGGYYHVMARFANNTDLNNLKFRLVIRTGSTVLWQGEQFYLSNPTDIIQDLGIVQLPPGADYTSMTGLSYNLAITGQKTGATAVISLDFIQFFPAENFCALTGLVPLAQNEKLFFGKAGQGKNYFFRQASAGSPNYVDWTSRVDSAIYLQPGRDNYIFFLWHTSTAGVAEVGRQLEIRIQALGRRAASL